MEWILPFQIAPLRKKIYYTDKIMFVGSCFSTEIGNQLQQLQFDVFQNPSGIVYHPLVISSILTRVVRKELFTPENMLHHNGLYHSWQHHSEFSYPDQDIVLSNINQRLLQAHDFLKSSHHLFITPATAFGYFRLENGELVANCHKFPAQSFEKRLIHSSEIAEGLSKAINEVKSLNPDIQIIFTVSPVRHIRDGIVQNNRSKAEVISAVHSLAAQWNLQYFPAYELVIDILRDYRFFKQDLAHPNDMAIRFVFEKFTDFAMDAETLKIMHRVREILNSASHQPKFPGTKEHLKFVMQQIEKINQLQDDFPFLKLEKVLQYYRDYVTAQSG